MMFSRTAEYALRVIVHLAGCDRRAVTTRAIAEQTGIPVDYLSKVLQSLSRAGLVKSQRGLHGGFVLLADPARLSLYDVLEQVEPMPRIRGCPLDLPCHADNLCPLHQRIDDAMARNEAVFRSATVAELLDSARIPE